MSGLRHPEDRVVEHNGDPGYNYNVPADGSLPPAVGEAPAIGYVCFDCESDHMTCFYTQLTQIRVVSCGDFALWELPPT
eukprot:SAG22_NODE_9724_length_573_cov_1.080169_1_plen_78_part_10